VFCKTCVEGVGRQRRDTCAMNNQLLRVYQMQVQSQCEFALMAIDGINQALEEMEAGRNDPEPGVSSEFLQASDRLWFYVNATLNSVANISKLLWPNSGRNQFPERRGAALRKSLGVPADSPLKHRKVRNHFEHVDERIETWWLESSSHNLATRNIGPLGALEPLQLSEIFEQFDQATLTVAFQGDKFELQPIADEITELLTPARRATGIPGNLGTA
jgi:hypothetical protein